MRRLAQRFSELRDSGRKAVIPYITAGDPSPTITVDAMVAMVNAGASIIELGVPFSDPMADGPVIQKASERALEGKMDIGEVFAVVKSFRERDLQTPVVLMGYLNPIETTGYDRFAERAVAAGVDGVLTVDLPPEEATDYHRAMQAVGLDTIFLVAPTSSPKRIRQICKLASGYIYYVSLKGVTGAQHLDTTGIADKVAMIRMSTDLPIGVGFGIRDAETARQVAAVSDAIVVGTVLVQQVEDLLAEPGEIPATLGSLIKSMRNAVDRL